MKRSVLADHPFIFIGSGERDIFININSLLLMVLIVNLLKISHPLYSIPMQIGDIRLAKCRIRSP